MNSVLDVGVVGDDVVFALNNTSKWYLPILKNKAKPAEIASR